ncbi:hypothetical protein O6C85_15005, partial [Legionella pneumophila]|uniref:hypothetical protein n=1 Tax=Legionella pneumophila TaxID=446 RepID=UPI0022B4FEB3
AEKIWIINESVSYFNEFRPQLLRRYAPRNDGPKNRTVQRKITINLLHKQCLLFYSCNANSS